jgi:hypothetical protein
MVAHFPFHLRELLGHQATYIITMAMREHRHPTPMLSLCGNSCPR